MRPCISSFITNVVFAIDGSGQRVRPGIGKIGPVDFKQIQIPGIDKTNILFKYPAVFPCTVKGKRQTYGLGMRTRKLGVWIWIWIWIRVRIGVGIGSWIGL